MATQFIPGFREANSPNRNQPELAIPGLQEEIKKKINRPVPELAIAEDTEILEAKASNGGNGKGNGHVPAKPASAERTVKTLSEAIAHFQQDAPACPNCGHVTVRNGACYKCLNCGESLGCS
jgi:ribonucleoside-diphosphate reductase alpha chain